MSLTSGVNRKCLYNRNESIGAKTGHTIAKVNGKIARAQTVVCSKIMILSYCTLTIECTTHLLNSMLSKGWGEANAHQWYLAPISNKDQ